MSFKLIAIRLVLGMDVKFLKNLVTVEVPTVQTDTTKTVKRIIDNGLQG